MILSRDAILKADDLPRVPVEVPEWGGTVYVRTMTGAERDRFDTSIIARSKDGDNIDTKGLRVEVVILTACDANGKLLFTDADKNALSSKSSAALNRVCDASRKLNGILDADGSNLEDAKKN